jgi:hypothetical protein
VKLVYLVGFITKKFSTMHGHTTVKYLALFGNFIQNDVRLDVLMALRLKTPRLAKRLRHVGWNVSKDPITFIFGIKSSNA